MGRGLSALMADIQPSEGATPAEAVPQGFADRNAPVEQLFPNPDQPRRSFSEDALEELAASIREKGVIQPPHCPPQPEG